MIPLRVYLKGFMSYRDETEFRFDGASLWVLAGRNGVGKSAVFDAITFALYGSHRGGSQNAQELINQQANELVVEFDFAIGEDIYRVKRTVSRKRASATFQAFSLVGANTIPKAIPGTDKRSEFTKWIEETIGLSLDTFTASAMLQQNKSDLLLTAKAADRHQMIAQLVDLSAYIKLHKYVDDQQKNAKQREKFCQDELNKIEPVDETKLTALDETIATLNEQVNTLQARIDRLNVLKEQAKRWSVLNKRYEEVKQKLAEIEALLLHREEIERNVKRLRTIRIVLPLLSRLAECQQQLEIKDVLIAQYQEQIEGYKQQVVQAKEQQAEALLQVCNLREEQRLHRDVSDKAQETLLILNPQMEEIKHLEEKRKEREKLTGDLKTLPSNIEQQLSTLLQEVKDLDALSHALPWLRQYTNARQHWQEAQDTLKEVHVAFEQFSPLLNIKLDELVKIEIHLNTAQHAVEETRQEQTGAKTLLGEAEKHLAHFREVDGQTNCSYCGQPLTAWHLEKERTRLEQEVQQAKDALANAQQKHKAAIQQQREQEADKRRLESEKKALEERKLEATVTQRKAQTSQETAEKQGRSALEVLPNTYKLRIKITPTDDIVSNFTGGYPTQVELNSFTQQVAALAEKQEQLKSIQQQEREYSVLLTKLEAVMLQLHRLENMYSPQQVQDIRCRHQEAQYNHVTTRERLKKIDDTLPKAESTLEEFKKVYQTTQEKVQRFTREQEVEQTRREALHDNREHQRMALPDEWQEKVAEASVLQCRSYNETLQQEETQLAGTNVQFDQLLKAQEEQRVQVSIKDQTKQDMEEIEQDAHVSPSGIEQEEQENRFLLASNTNEQNKFDAERRSLILQREQRENWEKQRREIAHQAMLYKHLAHLLGPEQLQNHLLLQAQSGIVTYANEILGRISSGTLQIELSQKEEGIGGTRSKTLDLVAYNSEIGTQALPVTFLSGSQKFRVAVGLALGIGQYTSSGTRQIESVIIDEGFGSLDKEGREEMIQEIRLLKHILKRIILVSHQEEVVDAFDNGYQIELIDRASRVRLR